MGGEADGGGGCETMARRDGREAREAREDLEGGSWARVENMAGRCLARGSDEEVARESIKEEGPWEVRHVAETSVYSNYRKVLGWLRNVQ